MTVNKDGMMALAAWAVIMTLSAATLKPLSAEPNKAFAQQLVEQTVAHHPELSGLEIAGTPPHRQCVTIAATEVKEIGEKCDTDEFTAIKTNKPFVEKEMEG